MSKLPQFSALNTTGYHKHQVNPWIYQWKSSVSSIVCCRGCFDGHCLRLLMPRHISLLPAFRTRFQGNGVSHSNDQTSQRRTSWVLLLVVLSNGVLCGGNQDWWNSCAPPRAEYAVTVSSTWVDHSDGFVNFRL